MFIMNNLKQARKEKGLTLEKLEKLTGIQFQNLSALELGKYKPTKQRRERIEKVLGKIDWSEMAGIKVTGGYRKAERLINELVGIYIGLNKKEKQGIEKLLLKYLNLK